MVKGYMTFAADMALIRHERFVKHVEEFCETVNLPVLINPKNSNETRIVCPFNHPHLRNNKSKIMQSQETRKRTNTGWILAEYEHQS